MNRFFGTFLSGAEELVEELLRSRLKDLNLLALLPGAVEFETEVPYGDLNLFCFNNLFLVLHSERTGPDEGDLKAYLRRLPKADANWETAGKNSAKFRTFRLVISRQNQLVSVDKFLRDGLEHELARRTGLRVDRSRPDAEFWVLSRSEGDCRFLKRLSRHTAYDKLLPRGELHPELAYLMCWLSAPLHTDRVLDPFCGHGAIPLQRCKRFPYSELLAFDKNAEMVRQTREKLARKSSVTVDRADALALSSFLAPESVDAVITDPPWGLFEDVGMELSAFYRQMLRQLCFVLKPGGRLVLLTAGKEELRRAGEASPELVFQKEYQLLVSGKKCGLFLLKKKG